MSNPFHIKEDAIISFSGGRTSAYMLYRVIEAHGGTLPGNISVVFANTGKEMPQTLDFVQECSEQWGVDIVWLERETSKYEGDDPRRKYQYKTVVVDYETASRDGEPFAALIRARSYLPNPVARFCTADLKIRAINDWAKERYTDNPIQLVGIRYDEPRRVAKMGGSSEGHEVALPLNEAKITVDHISNFWKQSSFDLKLPNNNGTTDLGNCDLCFLKGAKKDNPLSG